MEFFKKAIQISKSLAYTNILSPKSIFKVASIFGQKEGSLDVECHIYIHIFFILLTKLILLLI